MIQPDLFAYTPPPTEQERHLTRVSGKIGPAVLAFCERVGTNGSFHARDLHDHIVREMAPDDVAPDSSARILRLLKRQGIVDYVVIDRRASHYKIMALHT